VESRRYNWFNVQTLNFPAALYVNVMLVTIDNEHLTNCTPVLYVNVILVIIDNEYITNCISF
jgi:hypothetical protein